MIALQATPGLLYTMGFLSYLLAGMCRLAAIGVLGNAQEVPVASGEALQNAVRAGERAIVITEHLGVRQFAAPIAVIKEDMSIRGECTSPLPLWVPQDLDPALLPRKPSQCLIFTDEGLFEVRSTSFARVTVDNLYVRMQQFTLSQYRVKMTTFSGTSVWISNTTMQGDRGIIEAMSLFKNVALHISDSMLTNFNNTRGPLLVIEKNSSAVFERCTISDITNPEVNGSAVWASAVAARKSSSVLLRDCTLTNVPEPFFAFSLTSAGVFYSDTPLQVYQWDVEETSVSQDATILDVRPVAGAPFLRAEDRPAPPGLMSAQPLMADSQAAASTPAPASQLPDATGQSDNAPPPASTVLTTVLPPPPPSLPAQLPTLTEDRGGMDMSALSGGIAAAAVAVTLVALSIFIGYRLKKKRGLQRNRKASTAKYPTSLGGGLGSQSSGGRGSAQIQSAAQWPSEGHNSSNSARGQNRYFSDRPGPTAVQSATYATPAPGSHTHPAPVVLPTADNAQSHLQWLGPQGVPVRSYCSVHEQPGAVGRVVGFSASELRPTVTTTTTGGTSWADYERAASKATTALHALEVALDAVCGLKEPFFGRYMIRSSMQRRVGGQGLVQFGTIRHQDDKVAIKFYMDTSAFQRERDLYQDPELKSIMPATLAISQNSCGECCTPYGYCFPPFVIIECGQSLDEWAHANSKADFITIFQALSHSVKALQKLHSVGYAHRDIKPGNILRRYKEHDWTLIDFGCSAEIGTTADLAYSLKYAPPEIMHAVESGCRTITVDAAADMWAIGVIAYELLTGERAFPFEGLCRAEAEKKAQDAIAGRMLLPWEAAAEGYEGRLIKLRGLKGFVLQCLERDPAKRPSAEELLKRWDDTFDAMTAQGYA